ncbi:uncharacterized protein LOC131145431 [Malania oleifera]|uniref:uncharacterized protein LOC131145431 n=1 Tax=Malania oleifera TaxID=397392 RepID=UPI0025ADB492|nr:uncharacterized protein LOC131145431 [Malania oleifera]XP_057950485.1 uncharacterized protein LOC131145431 [Malania oleifera]XP_057950486.1 uncharacterized protein LOC131145431 [Malania oleifera]XP_057950487.1 uncharacterized protein LOC131145431 [Malania oleifera]
MEAWEDEESGICDLAWKEGLENYKRRCREFEERCKKDEERCRVLELEAVQRQREFELLEAKFKRLEAEKLATEQEDEISKRRVAELKERVSLIQGVGNVGGDGKRTTETIVDLTYENEDEDKVVHLMVENRVLECEKKHAEAETKVWEEKCKELGARVIKLEESLRMRCGWNSSGGNRDFHEGGGAKDSSNARKIEDELDSLASWDRGQTKETMMDSVDCMQRVHDSMGAKPISHSHPQEKAITGLQATGTLSINTPEQRSVDIRGEQGGIQLQTRRRYGNQVRKKLVFGEQGSLNRKIAPSIASLSKPASVGIIDISDNDDEPDNIQLPTPEVCQSKMVSVSNEHALEHKKMISENSLKRPCIDQSDEEDMNDCKENLLAISIPKRRRTSNIVTSDAESDSDDDNVPICKLKRKHLDRLVHDPTGSHLNTCSVASASRFDNVIDSVIPPRRRLMSMRQCEEKGCLATNSSVNLTTSETKYDQGIPTTEEVEHEEIEEIESYSESESSDGFIVDKSDVSDADDASSHSEDVSDGSVDFEDILSKIQRSRKPKSVWDFEADMLAAFGKDPELCMRAVCALYRQQTCDEKGSKDTLYHNQRGFSKLDAFRGSKVAEFLTDGDPKGEMNKSVKELQGFDPEALELCKTLATHYSKQLFEIYKNKEDPLFHPP